MPIYVQFKRSGLNLNAGKSKVHGMAFGSKTVTPRNLGQVVFHVAGETLGSTGKSSAQKSPHQPLVITKEKGSSSPLLFNAVCTREVLPSLDLYFTQGNPNGTEQVFVTITLTTATIVGYKTSHGLPSPPKRHPTLGASSVHTNELEEFDLVFSKITYTWVKGGKSVSDDWLIGS